MREKLAIVIHRYGKGINGGAEDHCRAIAEHVKGCFDITILTSCSAGTNYYDNKFEAGECEENSIKIIRFPTEQSFIKLDETISFIGPYCPLCIDYLKEHASDYSAIIFFTYTNWLSYAGLSLGLNNTIFIPTAHDEEAIHDPIVSEEFYGARAYLFNSLEERKLVKSIFSGINVPERTTCYGIDLEKYSGRSKEESITEEYILYAGRVSSSKNFDELNDYFLKYNHSYSSNLKLVVIGAIDNYMNITHHECIELRGFVDEQEKLRLMHNALCLILPSKNESLSIVLLESFACKRPVLAKNIAVLKDHCVRSGGGIYYSNYGEFAAALRFFQENREAADRMGQNGYEYVQKNYSWDLVIRNIVDVVNSINGIPLCDREDTIESYTYDKSVINISSIQAEISLKAKQYKEDIKNNRDKKIAKWTDRFLHETVVIVGAGVRGTRLLKVFNEVDSNIVVAFADNSITTDKCEIGGVCVYHISDAVKKYPNAIYIITPQFYYKELFEQLIQAGISQKQIDFSF